MLLCIFEKSGLLKAYCSFPIFNWIDKLNIDVNPSEEKNADTPKKNTGNKAEKKCVTLPYNDDGKPHYLSLCDSLSVYQPQEKTYDKALEKKSGNPR